MTKPMSVDEKGRWKVQCPEINDPDWLYNAYVVEHKTQRRIADELGISILWVKTKMKQFGIPGRPVSERNMGRVWTPEQIETNRQRMIEWWQNHPEERSDRPYTYNSRGERERVSRVVMEETLGRALTSKEVVHHIDGNPSNNAPENLKLFPNRGEHLAFHRRRVTQSDAPLTTTTQPNGR